MEVKSTKIGHIGNVQSIFAVKKVDCFSDAKI